MLDKKIKEDILIHRATDQVQYFFGGEHTKFAQFLIYNLISSKVTKTRVLFVCSSIRYSDIFLFFSATCFLTLFFVFQQSKI